MKSKIVSIFLSLMMVASISVTIIQNLGLLSMNASAAGGLADSPWPIFRQNLNHTGLSPYDTSTNNGQLLWSFETGDMIYSSPVLDSDGTIYIGSWDNKLYAINSNGTEKWNFTTSHWIEWSSPAIGSDGTIYVGSWDKKLHAINPNGTEKWNFTIGHLVNSSPTIGADGTIYVGSNNFHAINPDGSEKWSFTTIGLVISSPAIGFDGTIYVGSTNPGFKLYSVKPDGTEKWNFTTGNEVQSSPAIGSDGTIYVGSIDDNVYAINPDGTEKWNFTTGSGVTSSPAIGSDGTIYIGSNDHRLYAINPDGTEKWNFTTGDYIYYSSPAIGSDGTIYIGSGDDKLYAINPDGSKKWNFTTGSDVVSSPAIGSDGTIYVGSVDGKLYAIGNPSLEVEITSHFSTLNSAAQSGLIIHVTNDTNPVQGATINLGTDNGGMFSPQSGTTDINGNFTSIFNAPTVTTLIICRITAQANKTGYNNGSGYVDITIKPIPWPMFRHNLNHTGLSPYDTSGNPGKLKWKFITGGGVVSSPAIDSDGTIYIGSGDNKLYAINPNGTEKWNFTTGDIISRSSPAIDSDGTIYIGSCDNKLYAIYPDGTKKWEFIIGYDIWSSPAIGPDGMIYIGGGTKLWAINPDGTKKWSFETGGTVWSSPAIGSDGTIYISSYSQKLYAINPDGTEKWSFTAGSELRISSPAIGSDGVIYVGSKEWDNKLYAVNPNGTEKWSFMTGYSVLSSPAIGSDGTIYVGSQDNNLYAINPDGTEKWNFTTSGDVASSPAIGSDGTIYIGSDDGNLYAIEHAPPKIMVEKTANALVAKPGGTITYTIYYNNTLISNQTGELGHQQLTFENSDQYHPSYSPDGSKIVYTSFEDGGSYRDIWIMNADGSNHKQLTFEDYFQIFPSFNPDGNKILYNSLEDGGGYLDIWVMDADGSNHQQLTFEDSDQWFPRFSPDGLKIIYNSNEDGNINYDDIWIMDADGSNRQQLTFEDEDQFYPSFSPDGNKIVYSSKEDGSSSLDIWIMNADGSNHQQLTFEDYNQYYPSYSPNGSKIVYSSFEDDNSYIDIWIMDADGSNHQQLTNEDVDQLWPSFSPDGSKIIYYSKEDGSGYYDIWVLDVRLLPIKLTVWINDTLPSGVTFITSSAEVNRTGDFNWTFYNVGLGEHNFTITVQVDEDVPNGTVITNYVHLECTDSIGNSMPESSDSVDVTVLTEPSPPPPTLYINVSLDGENVILYWDPPSTPGIDHYLIYRSTSQIGFDFNTVWVNTSKDNESGEPNPIPLRTMWNDTKAALPGNKTNYQEQYYYVIRSVDILGRMSRTSRTVGKWTKTFQQGVSTFSLPLEPIDTLYTDYYTSSMKAEYIKYINTTTHTWIQHNFGDGNSNNTQMKLGEGYEVKFSSQTNYTFTGLPGAMIRYKTGGFTGFDYNTDAKNLSAQVDPLTGNVTLNWTRPSSMDGDDSYKVYRSTTRDGFDDGTAVLLDTLTYGNETYVDPGAVLLYNQCYYMVIPINETNVEGSSTYSIGIWTEEYLPGYDTLGIPLKLDSNQSADWYCDNIPDAVGINYYIHREQRWCWHSTRMPAGAYDPILAMAEGYQISTSNLTKFTFIGV